jgi:hypothetical protein
VLLLWIGFAVITAWWGSDLTAFLDGGSVRFLSPALGTTVVGGGMLVGALGGYAASRHAV